jgi:hypothetical protein
LFSGKLIFSFSVSLFSDWNFLCILLLSLPHSCCMSRISHPLWFNDCNDIRWRAGLAQWYSSSPGRSWEFSSSPPPPDRLWRPPSFLVNGYQGLFPWG